MRFITRRWKGPGKDPRYEAFYGAAILYREEPYMIQEPMPVDKVLEMEAHPLTKALILTKNAAFLFCRDRFPEALASIQKSIAFETQNHSAYVAYFNQTLKNTDLRGNGAFERCTGGAGADTESV